MSRPGLSHLRRAAAAPRDVLLGPTHAFADATPHAAWNAELPGSSVELVLELDGAWELELDGRPTRVGAFAAGMVVGPVRTRARGPVRLVQLAVDPLAIPALLGVPAGRLRGAAIPVDALLGRRTEQLLEALDASPDPAATAERWARTGVATTEAERGPIVPADVRRAAALIHASHGAARIDAIAAELGCSRRHLARSFAEWIGATPSEYRRLVRFESATSALRADPTQALGRLAADCGFADHAHMDREFAALAGATPTAVAARFAT